MATNKKYPKGDMLPITTATPYLPGQIVLEGALGGIAITETVDGEVSTDFSGVHEVDCADATYTVGQALEATAAQGEVQAKSAGALFAHSLEAKTTSGGTGKLLVRLCQGA